MRPTISIDELMAMAVPGHTPVFRDRVDPPKTVRSGNSERGMPWTASTGDPHNYLRKPLPPVEAAS